MIWKQNYNLPAAVALLMIIMCLLSIPGVLRATAIQVYAKYGMLLQTFWDHCVVENMCLKPFGAFARAI